ncbi:MAG: TlpA family protein disulfide reductase [Acidobacteria bacterium]|nr:TlpA family protein disulfide reductase [Acidobacteriota bacterium]
MSKTNVAKLVAVGVILGGAIFLLVYRQRFRIPELGDSAPDFTLPTLRGDSLRLSDYRRQVVVLNFWATWCPPCVEETPSLNKFAGEMTGQGVAVLSVSVDEDTKALEEFVSKYNLTFPVARDPEQAVTSRYGTFKFPETYILDEDGRIADKFIGAVDWQDPRINEFVLNLARFRVR